MPGRLSRTARTAAAALLGLLAGCVGGSMRHLLSRQAEYPFLAERTPLPHHVPQYRGGLSFRFAMAHDVIHERFGQRRIAWSAFERAVRLADRFWPDRVIQEFLRGHCRKRQAAIEQTLTGTGAGDSRRGIEKHFVERLSPAEVADLRPRFEAELGYGEGYQRAYQEYEAKRLAAGASLADEHFFDAFHAGREPIASTVGPEEQFVWVPRGRMAEYASERRWAWGAFGAGAAALLVAGLLRWRTGRAVR